MISDKTELRTRCKSIFKEIQLSQMFLVKNFQKLRKCHPIYCLLTYVQNAAVQWKYKWQPKADIKVNYFLCVPITGNANRFYPQVNYGILKIATPPLRGPALILRPRRGQPFIQCTPPCADGPLPNAPCAHPHAGPCRERAGLTQTVERLSKHG